MIAPIGKEVLVRVFLSEEVKLRRVNLGAFAKLQKATISFVMSVCTLRKTGFPLDGLSWNLIFRVFLKSLARKFNFH